MYGRTYGWVGNYDRQMSNQRSTYLLGQLEGGDLIRKLANHKGV